MESFGLKYRQPHKICLDLQLVTTRNPPPPTRSSWARSIHFLSFVTTGHVCHVPLAVRPSVFVLRFAFLDQ